MTEYKKDKKKDSRTKRDRSKKAKYTCKYCGKSMIAKENLYEHLKKWHKMLKPRTKRTLRKEYDRE